MSTGNYQKLAAQYANALWAELSLCVRRVVQSDLQIEWATPAERTQLASISVPITHKLMQDFVAWRRSMLWVAAAFISTHAVLSFFAFQTVQEMLRPMLRPMLDEMYDIEFQLTNSEYQASLKRLRDTSPEVIPREVYRQQQFQAIIGDRNAWVINGLGRILLASTVIAAGMVVFAASYWTNIRASRKWGRMSWLVLVGVPVIVSCLPMTGLMSFDESEEPELSRVIWGFVFALSTLLTIVPKAIAIFPGIIRSCITVKTLLPESAAPGWIAVIMAPLYAVLLLALVGVMNQFQSSVLLFGGVICYIVGSLIYLWSAKEVIRPHAAEQTLTVIRRIRWRSSLFTIVGTVLLLAYIASQPNFRWSDAAIFLSGVGGSVILMTVVASDLIVDLLHVGYQQSCGFSGTDLQAKLDEKYQMLAESGFTASRESMIRKT